MGVVWLAEQDQPGLNRTEADQLAAEDIAAQGAAHVAVLVLELQPQGGLGVVLGALDRGVPDPRNSPRGSDA